ncbi:class I SAM-dependent methyltransferase [Paraconexibacter sp.]|uniref:class I SAM-dependent methyltransferase n=1 Tax=Paraconexibacter sp. TaxID=2949640 RepID=UPI0035698265
MTDWGDGTYEMTADDLAPAAERAVEIAAVASGDDVLDIACGTGNAAAVAADRGARVTGVDPAARLLDVARGRVPDGTFLVGDGAALPLPDDTFDVTLSVFGVIFVPDATAAVSEAVRVTRPGGRIVITSWVPEGAIAGAGQIVRRALTERMPADERASTTEPVAWGDPAFLREAFERHGASVTVTEELLPFTDASPATWFDEQAEHHPMWRAARAELADHAAAWQDVRQRTIALLTEQNEDPQAFRATSRYLVARADLPRD